MSSRDEILARLRSSSQAPTPCPDLNQPWTTWPDPVAQFQESVAAVGGQAVRLNEGENLTEAIAALEVYTSADRVASCSAHTNINGISLDEIQDPHTLEDLDLFIADGTLGVAENGAIWITDAAIAHRAALFITQHLILTVEGRHIVNNMYEAYQQIQIPRPGFGLFLSGPSKTADIEQSLVIGAHGARSLMVFIID